ncbi:MAG: glutathione S-transferase family protein [Rhodospirillales bacterium]|nr:glutathione S-transferase family protein [Rhodospirillales bacterium]
MLEFYMSQGSACCRKVHMVLHEKNLDWTNHVFDLRRGDQLSADYRLINPNAEVPTLVHDGVPIIQSTVIMEYLDEVFPTPTLKPADAIGRASIRQWCKWPDEGGHVGYSYLAFAVSHRHIPHDPAPGAALSQLTEKPDAERQERQRQAIELGLDAPAIPGTMRRFDKLFGDMEAALEPGGWLAGDEFSLADIAIAPYASRLSDMKLHELWEAERPLVTDWFERLKQRPSYEKGIVENASPKVAQLMAENGSAAWPKLKAMID